MTSKTDESDYDFVEDYDYLTGYDTKGAENQNFAFTKFASVRKSFEYEMTWLLGEFYYNS